MTINLISICTGHFGGKSKKEPRKCAVLSENNNNITNYPFNTRAAVSTEELKLLFHRNPAARTNRKIGCSRKRVKTTDSGNCHRAGVPFCPLIVPFFRYARLI